MLILTLFVLVGAVLAVLFLKRYAGRLRSGEVATDKGPPRAQDFLDFLDIQDGVLVLPGGRYRAVIEVVGTVNFGLLSEAEQEQVEASFGALLSSLSFPVQMFVQTRLLDLGEQVAEARRGIDRLPESMRDYAAAFAGHLTEWMKSRTVLTRRNYIVIPYDGPGDFDVARRELQRRVEAVEGEVNRWLGSVRLDTERLTDVLYVAYNKSRAVSAHVSDAASHGFLVPFVKGVSFRDAASDKAASAAS
ncbi:MAG: hypothetical protein ACYC9Q_05420 [Bacillota bacterium]